MWDVFKNNASVFNEESGEVVFSVLARDIASSGVRSDCEAVSRKFRIIKPKMVVAKGLNIDCTNHRTTRAQNTILTRTQAIHQ